MNLTHEQIHELIMLNNANRLNCVAKGRPWPHFTNVEHLDAAASDLRAVSNRLDTLRHQLSAAADKSTLNPPVPA